jgi:hypothetical protein
LNCVSDHSSSVYIELGPNIDLFVIRTLNMSHQGTSFASEKNVLQDVLKRDIKQAGRFSPESTAEEVAKVLASDITGKIGK